ncbi:hypothetical protein LPJ61_000877 [Coemansia biformis]|uniref:RING-type domain-containing protein n=1 Tax=Coemansia biformis TaxID=1286918 RepID=A0A9W8CYN1_9FUNG|nr:hypothetical protein LPJ61_000877 [Coemansia biformis]
MSAALVERRGAAETEEPLSGAPPGTAPSPESGPRSKDRDDSIIELPDCGGMDSPRPAAARETDMDAQPPQPLAEAEAALSGLPSFEASEIRGRRSIWQAVRRAFRGMRPMKRARVLVLTSAAVIQFVAGIVALVLSARAHEICDRPLRTFVILHVIRLAMLRHLLELGSLVLFLCGNDWVFTSDTGRSAAPLLYYTSFAFVLLGYLYLSVPVSLAIVVGVAFVLAYTFSAEFRMRLAKKRGADLGQISQIPLVRYTDATEPAHVTSLSSPPSIHTPALADAPPRAGSLPAASLSATSLRLGSSRRRQRRHGLTHIHILNPFARIAHRLTRSKRQREADAEVYKSQLAGPVPDFAPPDPEDSVCAICLSDYEEGDVLRLLPCSHHMHQACVDEWLHINQTCPLCKQPATGASAAPDPASAPATEPAARNCAELPGAAGTHAVQLASL